MAANDITIAYSPDWGRWLRKLLFVLLSAIALPACSDDRTSPPWTKFVQVAGQPDPVPEVSQKKRSQEQFQKYREAAWAHFHTRCQQSAGEKIFLKVDNVRGVLLLRPRRQATDAELRDQYWRGDPYGHDSVLADSEIRNFLGYLNERDIASTSPTTRPGYKYVEVKEAEGTYRRYELEPTTRRIASKLVAKPSSRYGVTWTDVSTDEDREYWIAGGKLDVIDLESNTVIGERIGYLLEPGFGSRAGGRQPWGHARLTSSDYAACPQFPPRRLVPINRLFVEKVLKPASGGPDAK